MAPTNKIRVGIVGVSADRGFASIAHIPALQALPHFELSAVCTTRQESAEAAARHFGVPLAFCDAEKLAQHPDVDLVTVSVKVPDHYLPVMAAIEAGKHVYCEWPLGRDTDEAIRMREAAERKGVRHAVGLQGQVSPAINYAKDLIADGYVGRVLSATMIGCAPNWGPTIDRAYQADFANGANLLTITGGHTIDALCYCLGEFRELAAFVVSQRDRIPARGNRRDDRKDLARPTRRQWHCRRRCGRIVSGPWRHEPRDRIPVRDPRGPRRPPAHRHLASLHAAARTELEGARGDATALADLPIPGKYRWVPEGVPPDSRYNVAQLYVRLAESIRDGKPASPGFDAAVTRHRLLDAIVRGSETGMKQVVQN